MWCCECWPGGEATQKEALVCDPQELISSGFVRAPPIVITCIEGPALQRSLKLRPTGWGAQQWQFDASLAPVEGAQQDDAVGFRLLCVNGSYFISALNERSPLWYDVGSRYGGPGAVAVSAGDLMQFEHGTVRVEKFAGAHERGGPAAGLEAKPASKVHWVDMSEAGGVDIERRASDEESERRIVACRDSSAGEEGESQRAALLGAGTTLRGVLSNGLKGGLRRLRSQLNFSSRVWAQSKTLELGELHGGLATSRKFARIGPARQHPGQETNAPLSEDATVFLLVTPHNGATPPFGQAGGGSSAVTSRYSREEAAGEELSAQSGSLIEVSTKGKLRVRHPADHMASDSDSGDNDLESPAALPSRLVVARLQNYNGVMWLQEARASPKSRRRWSVVSSAAPRAIASEAPPPNTASQPAAPAAAPSALGDDGVRAEPVDQPSAPSEEDPATTELMAMLLNSGAARRIWMRAAVSTSTPLPMGMCFRLADSTYRISTPTLAQRQDERWVRLAVALRAHGGPNLAFVQLPSFSAKRRATIGRAGRRSRATLPLRDLKVRRRHAYISLKGLKGPSEKRSELHGVNVGDVWLTPHKGKPCSLLLGRSGQQVRPRWRLSAGDIFIIGHSQFRVVELTQLTARLSTKLIRKCSLRQSSKNAKLVNVVDTGRRYTRKANKEKKRIKKLSDENYSYTSSDDSDEGPSQSSGDELLGGVQTKAAIKLEMVAGPWRGRCIQFGDEGICIGSSAACGLSLSADLTVSPFHARIAHVCGEWFLSDAGSSSGTFLLIPDRGLRLDIGDVVRVGRTEIVMMMQLELTNEKEDGLASRRLSHFRMMKYSPAPIVRPSRVSARSPTNIPG